MPKRNTFISTWRIFKNGKLEQNEDTFSDHFQNKTWSFELKKKHTEEQGQRMCKCYAQLSRISLTHDVEQKKPQKNKYDHSIYVKQKYVKRIYTFKKYIHRL